MTEPKCKICRRLGIKLFLKGEKCLSPKCPMVRRPYPPGQKGKRRTGGLSEYGRELREKQKLRRWYNIREKQFKNYVMEVLTKNSPRKRNLEEELIRKLEKRLDNVIFRAGIAVSRGQARQMVSHGHFTVNGKSVDIPSFEVRKGDIIELKENSKNKKIFQESLQRLKDYEPPSWISVDKKNLAIEIKGEPSLEEAAPPVESISKIFEFYSK